MFHARFLCLSQKLSPDSCSSKPVVGLSYAGAQHSKGPRSRAHISQCEMAGMLSGLQVYPYESNKFTPWAEKITIKRKAGGAESANVECAKSARVVIMSDVQGLGDRIEVVEERNSIGSSQKMGPRLLTALESAAQDRRGSLSIGHSVDNVSPLFSFGVITDVQYADVPDGRSFSGVPRFYRHALEVVRRAVTSWNHRGGLAFSIHLGDLVDGLSKHEPRAAFAKVLAEFDAFKSGPVYHMIGNHCLYNLPRSELNRLFSIPPTPDGHSYYDFSPHSGFRVVVLDGYDISELGWPEDHPNAQLAMRLLSRINPNEEKNSPIGLEGNMTRFVKFNGGVGKDQLTWLDCTLQKASVTSEKAIIFCHLPLYPGTSDPLSMCWNYADVLEILQRHPCVVACLSGHAHSGGYIVDLHGIHYVVLEAVLECPPGEDAFGVIEVFHNRLSLVGHGRMTSRELYFRE